MVARAWGWSLPRETWSIVVGGATVGWLWPTPNEWALLSLGRALGLGERLASLQALSHRPTSGVAALLAADLQRHPWRPWRVVAGKWELGACLCVIVLVGVLWIPSAEGPSAADSFGRREQLAPDPGGDAQDDGAPADSRAEHTPLGPSQAEGKGTAGYTPYKDIVAAVFGLDEAAELWENPDEFAEALGRQQGLLRELSNRLSELAFPAVGVDRVAQVGELASELAREDLRDLVLEAARSSDEQLVAVARDALDAVLATHDPLQEGAESTDQPGSEGDPKDAVPAADESQAGGFSQHGGPAPGGANGTDWQPHLPEGVGGLPELNGVQGDPTAQGGFPGEDVDRQRGGPPGSAAAQPPAGGESDQPHVDPDESPVPVAVRTEDGGWRAYLVVGVPGENPGELGERVVLSAQEVDLLLRARAVPSELRDVVRRYFEHVATEAGGER